MLKTSAEGMEPWPLLLIFEPEEMRLLSAASADRGLSIEEYLRLVFSEAADRSLS